MSGPTWLLAGSLDGTGATAHRPGCPHAAGARPWRQVADLDEAQRREFMAYHGAVTACPTCLPAHAQTTPAAVVVFHWPHGLREVRSAHGPYGSKAEIDAALAVLRQLFPSRDIEVHQLHADPAPTGGGTP